MDSFFGELIKLGAAGLVIWVIAAPLIKYLIDRSKTQDTRMNDLVDNHLLKDTERQTRIISSLDSVDGSLGQVNKSLGQVQEVLTNKPRGATTVNVAAPVGAVNGDRIVHVEPTAEVPTVSEKTKIEGTVKLTPDK